MKSVADNEFGLGNRKWEELTKDIHWVDGGVLSEEIVFAC